MGQDRTARVDRDLRSYGRRGGRKLSQRQERILTEVLPRLAPDLASPCPSPLASLFEGTIDRVWLEVGFGGGEHLIWQAQNHPRVGIIGCEPFRDGVTKVASAVEDAAIRNIRLHPDDARALVRWLPPASVERIFVLFPDPWPKVRHRKRRLVAAPFLRDLARVARPGALLRFATDIGDYARTALLAVREEGSFVWRPKSPADWQTRDPDWPATRYELKAGQAGRRSYYFRFERGEH
jgi:tRNA (guanine-N7-)-methyltransferase